MSEDAATPFDAELARLADPQHEPPSFSSIPSREAEVGQMGGGMSEADQDVPKVKFDTLLGHTIGVYGFDILDSQFEEGKTFAVIRFVDQSDNKMVTMTGSGVIQDQLKRLARAGAIPFQAKVDRHRSANKGYTYYAFEVV